MEAWDHSLRLNRLVITSQVTRLPDFPRRHPTGLNADDQRRAEATLLRHPIADNATRWYRNIYLLSIDYAFRPRLRSRLTQGRLALPWNPWVYGGQVSRLTLATHSSILSCLKSTSPYGLTSSRRQCSPTHPETRY